MFDDVNGQLIGGDYGQAWESLAYAKSSYADCLTRFLVLIIWRHWIAAGDSPI